MLAAVAAAVSLHSMADMLKGPPAHPVLPQGSRTLHDLAYGADPAQRLDVYLPPHPQHAPVLFLIHGGAWIGGDKDLDRVVDNKAAHWTSRGYAVVFPNYRLFPAVRPLDQAEDVARALAYVQRHAAGWGADGSRLVVLGHSAGGHLAGLLAADPQIAAREGARPWRGTVLLDSAAYDVIALMQAPHLHFYDRLFGSDPAAWLENSPTLRLNSRPAPLLLICSSQRRDGCPQAKAFAARARSLGAEAELDPVGLSHADISEKLGADPGYTAMVDGFLDRVGLNGR